MRDRENLRSKPMEQGGLGTIIAACAGRCCALRWLRVPACGEQAPFMNARVPVGGRQVALAGLLLRSKYLEAHDGAPCLPHRSSAQSSGVRWIFRNSIGTPSDCSAIWPARVGQPVA